LNINNKLQVNWYGALFRYTRTVAISIGHNICHSFYIVFGILQSKNLQLHLKKKAEKNQQNIMVTGTNWINDSHCLLHTEIDSEGMLRTKLYGKRDYFNFLIVNFPFICKTLQRYLDMEYVSLNWSNIPEFVITIVSSLKACDLMVGLCRSF